MYLLITLLIIEICLNPNPKTWVQIAADYIALPTEIFRATRDSYTAQFRFNCRSKYRQKSLIGRLYKSILAV